MATTLKERNIAQDAQSDKDSTEDELERLIFGDSAGFRSGLRNFQETGDAEIRTGKELVVVRDSDSEGEKQDTGYAGLADKDLFYFDDEPGDAPQILPTIGSDSEEGGASAAAWSDSDDERITVSLATNNRLRKLRQTQADDVVTGKEYSRRLRRQFKILNPVPDWVKTASRPARKKRRTSRGSEDSSDDYDGAMDVDTEDDSEDDDGDISTLPLARLLRDADALTRSTAQTGKGRKRKYKPEAIDIQRMKDIVPSGPSAITCLQVHPKLPLLLSSGPSKTMSLHHLQPQPPEPNPLLTTLHIKKTPLFTTAFQPSTSDPRIFLAGRRRYMHVWDLSTGLVEKISKVYGHQDEQQSFESFKLSHDGKLIALLGSAKKGGGILNILDANTMQWIAQARVESHGGIADFAWWRNSQGLAIAGKSGEITEWSVESRSAVARWRDEGAVGTTTFALGGDSGRDFLGGDRWAVVGSQAGIVNIYDRRAWIKEQQQQQQQQQSSTTSTTKIASLVPARPKPTRSLDNLTTSISHLAISPDGQILVLSSRWKGDALRLVHLPTCTVYKNWPTSKTPLGRVTAVAFGEVEGDARHSAVRNGSSSGGKEEREQGNLCLLIGNERGALRGWEIRE